MKLTTNRGKAGRSPSNPGSVSAGFVRSNAPAGYSGDAPWVIEGAETSASAAERVRNLEGALLFPGNELPKVPKDFFCFFAKQNRGPTELAVRTPACVSLEVFRDLMPAYDWRRSDWTTSNKIQARSSNRPQSARHNDRRRGLSSAAGQQAPREHSHRNLTERRARSLRRVTTLTRRHGHAHPRAETLVNFPIGNPRCPLETRALITPRA